MRWLLSRHFTSQVTGIFVGMLVIAPIAVPASSPALSLVLPQSAQRGTESDTTFQGERLGDAQEILFYEPGISTVSLNNSNATQLKVRLKVEPTARLGQHVVRVRTAAGSAAQNVAKGHEAVRVDFHGEGRIHTSDPYKAGNGRSSRDALRRGERAHRAR